MPKWPPGRAFPRRVSHIVIHHSGTEDSDTLSWGAIRQHHLAKGWDDIGYHAGIELIRGTYQILRGRSTDRTGAHVGEKDLEGVRWNHKALGFCFVGNFDLEAPTDELLEEAAKRWLVPELHVRGLDVDALIPHRMVADYKSCPGDRFDMDRLRDICSRLLQEV